MRPSTWRASTTRRTATGCGASCAPPLCSALCTAPPSTASCAARACQLGSTPYGSGPPLSIRRLLALERPLKFPSFPIRREAAEGAEERGAVHLPLQDGPGRAAAQRSARLPSDAGFVHRRQEAEARCTGSNQPLEDLSQHAPPDPCACADGGDGRPASESRMQGGVHRPRDAPPALSTHHRRRFPCCRHRLRRRPRRRRLRLVRARRRPWCRRPRRQESGMCVGECEGLRLESARDCVGERWYSVKLAAMTL